MTESSNPMSLTPEQDLMNYLDDHFFFLLGFYESPAKNLNDADRALARQWIEKLSTIRDDQTITTKTRRNEYLTKLLGCIQNGTLCAPFNQSPLNSDQLPYVDFGYSTIVEEIPQWVEDLKRREESEVKVGGKGFETYLSSKLLKNGACAYLAVSAQTPGSDRGWQTINPNKARIDQINKLFNKEFGEDAAEAYAEEEAASAAEEEASLECSLEDFQFDSRY